MWYPLELGEVKANLDGALRGNLSLEGIGISFRDKNGEFLYILAMGTGEIYWAECLSIVVAVGTKNSWLINACLLSNKK